MKTLRKIGRLWTQLWQWFPPGYEFVWERNTAAVLLALPVVLSLRYFGKLREAVEWLYYPGAGGGVWGTFRSVFPVSGYYGCFPLRLLSPGDEEHLSHAPPAPQKRIGGQLCPGAASGYGRGSGGRGGAGVDLLRNLSAGNARRMRARFLVGRAAAGLRMDGAVVVNIRHGLPEGF